MIELVIAALIQIATITSDGTVTSTESTAPVTMTAAQAGDGGTGTWDDND